MSGLELMNRLEILITYMNQQKKSEKAAGFSSSPSAFSVHQLAFWERESPK